MYVCMYDQRTSYILPVNDVTIFFSETEQNLSYIVQGWIVLR